MLSRKDNELLVQTGPGTPGGEMMRRYWHPVALTEQLPPDGAPTPCRLLGEDLLLFRDEAGRVGLLGLQCPHRCADLSYGRIEDGGLRCLYHGWLFDIEGRCLDQPAEPADSRYKEAIRHTAYPCIERGGLVFAYLGGGEPPVLPDYEFLRAHEDHRFILKTVLDCNYLQGLEGEIDPSHLSYLHRPIADKDRRNVPGTTQSADHFYREKLTPKIECHPTDFGLRILAVRDAGPDRQYLRITNFIMPNKAAIIGSEGRTGEGYSVHWHVPIDDTHHLRFDFIYNRVRPLDKEHLRKETLGELTADHRYIRNAANRYLQDRALMKTSNFNGMGDFFNVHDAFATESQGAIHDRSREHLATADICIVNARRQLLAAVREVAEGRDPLHVVRDPAQADASNIVVVSEVIPSDVDPREFWRQRVQTAGA
jgi:phthalate 4,5-dioxygenase oxygenase subunit